MNQRFLLPGLSLAALLLELLPWGVAMRFMVPPGEDPVLKTTSYFDLTPFGYGNFAPLITAILTCLLVLLTLLYAIRQNTNWLRPAKVISPVATVVSGCPIFVGSYTLLGGIISALLLCQMVCLMRKQN